MFGKTGNLIVVSGLASCGKGCFIQKISSKFNAYYVPSAHYFAVKSFPMIYSSKDSYQAKQEYYIELDKKVSQIAQYALRDNKFVIQDCNYIASLAYDYAIYKENGDRQLFKWIVDSYIEALESLELVVPDVYVFLDASISVRRQRSAFEPNLDVNMHFDEEFSNNLKYVHTNFMKIVNSLNIDYNNEQDFDNMFAVISSSLHKAKSDAKASRKKVLNFLKSLV